jgi:hypothetical protein
MPLNPSLSSVHVNQPLTNISIAYTQSNTNFVADRVFPVVPVSKQSDNYFTYDREDWFRSEMRKRAPGTESAGAGYGVSTALYSCDVFALHKDIADQIRANEDTPLNSDRDATEWLALQAKLKKESDFASTYMAGGIWTYEADGVASSPTASGSFDPTNASNNDKLQWNDASATPIEDVRQGKRFVMEKTGFTPNVMVMGQTVFDSLIDHPDVIDRIKYGQTAGGPALAGNQALAQIFGVDEILVGSGVQNTAAEGATETNSFILGKHALLTYRAPRPSIMTPSAGYTFSWNGYLGGGNGAPQISKFRMDMLKSDRIEAEMAYDQKLVAADLGYFFDGIVA